MLALTAPAVSIIYWVFTMALLTVLDAAPQWRARVAARNFGTWLVTASLYLLIDNVLMMRGDASATYIGMGLGLILVVGATLLIFRGQGSNSRRPAFDLRTIGIMVLFAAGLVVVSFLTADVIVPRTMPGTP